MLHNYCNAYVTFYFGWK